VFEKDRDFMGSNFQHSLGAGNFAVGAVSKSGIEETGVVDAKFADGRVIASSSPTT
jgi:hypothetical protein